MQVMENFEQLFKKFSSIKAGVIGDVMLDSYIWGEVERISPEAPVPVVTLKKKDHRIGGAGNVALNLQSLGAKPYVISVTGDDAEADMLNALLSAKEIDHSYCVRSRQRITTNKTRVICRNQQMMRLDGEITNDLENDDQQMLIERFQKFLEDEKPDIVILEEYNKGILTETVIRVVVSMCKTAGVLTAVDPKRKNFFEFKHVDIFKPNLKEVKEALNFVFQDPNLLLLQDAHSQMSHLLKHHISLITLSEKGIFYNNEKASAIIPSHLRNIADVSGAGDTVIAVAALVYSVSRNVHLMAEMANIAGGLVCEQVGTAAIDKIKLLHECELLLS